MTDSNHPLVFTEQRGESIDEVGALVKVTCEQLIKSAAS